jgi:hypothetical protein
LSIQIAFDCTRANIGRAPGGLLAGYTTGSSDIRWTAADWKAHPDAVRIDQDPAASDDTADVLDVEGGAATLADVPGWSKRALAAYRAGKRPGQRSPLIYMSQVNVTPVANVLAGAGLADGSVGLFIANWNLSRVQAAAEVLAASGPFPVHGLQFQNAGDFDIDVFSSAWLHNRAGVPKPAQQAFGPPENITVRPGDSTVLVETCDAPMGMTPGHFEVSVFTGSYPSPQTLVASYPRYMRAAPQQFGSLQGIPSGTHMTLRVTAVDAFGVRSAYADTHFEMP